MFLCARDTVWFTGLGSPVNSQALLGVADLAGPSFVPVRLPSLLKGPPAALSAG